MHDFRCYLHVAGQSLTTVLILCLGSILLLCVKLSGGKVGNIP